MTTVAPLPDLQTPSKRPESDLVQLPEPKRPKLGDGPGDKDIELQSYSEKESKQDGGDSLIPTIVVDDDLTYCVICRKMVKHKGHDTCPNRSKGYGMVCTVCLGRCKNENGEHADKQMEFLKFCDICGTRGSHWSDECPFENFERIYDLYDQYSSDPDDGF